MWIFAVKPIRIYFSIRCSWRAYLVENNCFLLENSKSFSALCVDSDFSPLIDISGTPPYSNAKFVKLPQAVLSEAYCTMANRRYSHSSFLSENALSLFCSPSK